MVKRKEVFEELQQLGLSSDNAKKLMKKYRKHIKNMIESESFDADEIASAVV